MGIPMAVVLGLACLFYLYVATRWWRETMLIRRENKRSSSKIVHLFSSDAKDADAAHNVIVMGQPKTGKLQKRVVA